jgi:hypothetical protein
MTVRMKGNIGKLTGAAGVVRKADKVKNQSTPSTKKAEGNLKSKTK